MHWKSVGSSLLQYLNKYPTVFLNSYDKDFAPDDVSYLVWSVLAQLPVESVGWQHKPDHVRIQHQMSHNCHNIQTPELLINIWIDAWHQLEFIPKNKLTKFTQILPLGGNTPLQQ